LDNPKIIKIKHSNYHITANFTAVLILFEFIEEVRYKRIRLLFPNIRVFGRNTRAILTSSGVASQVCCALSAVYGVFDDTLPGDPEVDVKRIQTEGGLVTKFMQ
jgi:hypothetical protein